MKFKIIITNKKPKVEIGDIIVINSAMSAGNQYRISGFEGMMLNSNKTRVYGHMLTDSGIGEKAHYLFDVGDLERLVRTEVVQILVSSE